MHTLTGRQVETLDPTEPVLRQAVELLAASVPAACRELVAYHAPRYPRYLAAALAPPAAYRTVILRGLHAGAELAAVADWRVVPDSLLLNGIAVRDTCRGHGLGGRLLADGERLAAALGLPALALDVELGNDRARGWYLRAGFVDRAFSSWHWYDLRCAPAGTTQPPRILDWPRFHAHYLAYGFGDCSMRGSDGTVRTARVVDAAVRAEHGSDVAVLSAVHADLPRPALAYRITPAAPGGQPFARFAGMRKQLT